MSSHNLEDLLRTAAGRRKLYDSLHYPMAGRLQQAGIPNYGLRDERDFWLTVGREAEQFHITIAEAFIKLVGQVVNPTTMPPHPLLGRLP